MDAARDHAGLATTHMAWNMVAGVLHAFRRRLAPDQAFRFADQLPPAIRGLFVEGWRRPARKSGASAREPRYWKRYALFGGTTTSLPIMPLRRSPSHWPQWFRPMLSLERCRRCLPN
ncbi:DUF2267 domain-containing protein [Paracidovorax oryzae]|uniref:DUF2267 domain-containing protein n=1 Tax=Paracidovorax oryzae TaxID=862720 RepID=UPI0035CFAC89